jgi:hypothetical protein
MTRSTVRLLALILPLLGLALTWAYAHVRAQQGTEWDVPVRGSDPRDLLRGHYIVYSYDWPGLDPKIEVASAGELCLIGTAPRIVRTEQGPLDGGPCANRVAAVDRGSSALRGNGLDGGILYVAQTQTRRLERQLADPKLQGVVRIRLREDGMITPLRITFRPRPVVPPVVPAPAS